MSEPAVERDLTEPATAQVEQRTSPPLESAAERASLLEEMIYEGMREGVWNYYMSLHPSDRAAVLTELPGRIRRSLAREMRPETLAGLLDYMEPRLSARVLRDFSPDALADVLDLTDPATSTEILGRLSSAKRLETIEAMEASKPVETLLRYEEDSIGRLMDPYSPVLTENTTVPIALDRLRLMGRAAEEVRSLLVVNDYGVLVGSLNPVRLALARPSATVNASLAGPPHTRVPSTSKRMRRFTGTALERPVRQGSRAARPLTGSWRTVPDPRPVPVRSGPRRRRCRR